MPNRDKTGPEGKGAKTGRGAGNCDTPASDKKKKVTQQRPRNGQGRNWGRGRMSGTEGDGDAN